MPRAVGLDIGSRYLKLVELTGSAKAFRVTRTFVRPVPRSEGEGAAEQDAAALAAMVADLFREARLPKDDVCASFDAGSTIFREMVVPFHEPDQIAKTIRYEAENHLHGRAIEDVVVNWIKTGDTREGSQILVMAAPKADLASDLALLQAAGIDPASVDLDATALFTACHATGVFEENPNVIVLEIGARTTNLLLVDGGRLRTIRSFLVGADSVSSAIQQDLSLPAGEAEKRALASGPDRGALILPVSEAMPAATETGKGVAELERDAALQRRDDFVRKLHREVTRSHASARLDNPPQKILVAGGGSLLPGVQESLKERFGLEVEPLRLLSRVGAAPAAEDAEFQEAVMPSAMGCALRLLGADPLRVELRREEFAPGNLFDVVRGALAAGVTLLVATLLAVVLVTKDRLWSEQTAHAAVTGRALQIYQETEAKYLELVKNVKPDKAAKDALRAKKELQSEHNDANLLPHILSMLKARHKELETQLGLSKDFPKIESALLVWVEIWGALKTVPRADLGPNWFRVKKLSVSQNSASLGIEVEDLRYVDKAVAAISQNEYLKGRAKNPLQVVIPAPFNRNQKTTHFEGSLDIPFDPDR